MRLVRVVYKQERLTIENYRDDKSVWFCLQIVSVLRCCKAMARLGLCKEAEGNRETLLFLQGLLEDKKEIIEISEGTINERNHIDPYWHDTFAVQRNERHADPGHIQS